MSKLSEKLKNSKKFRIRFIVILLLILLIFGTVGYTVFIRPNRDADEYIYKETKVEFGNLYKGINESGTVALEESSVVYNLDLSEEDEDEDDDDDDEDEEDTVHYLEIEEVYAVQGQRISEGDPLFKLSSESIEAVRKRLTTRQTEAKIDLADAQLEYDTGLISGEGTYKASKAQASNAASVYNSTLLSLQAQLDNDRATMIQLTEEINMLQEDLEDEDLYTARTEAYNKLEVAKNKYESTELVNVEAYTSNYEDYVAAEETYEAACQAIDSLVESIQDKADQVVDLEAEIAKVSETLETKKMEAKQTYDSAIASGESADEILEYTKKSLEETVTEAETSEGEIDQLISDFEAFVGSDGIIYADGSGLVTAVNNEAGDELVSAGTLLTYVKEDAYSVSIDVLEEDIPSITVGDSVDVEFGVYEGEVWKGTIASISTTANRGSTVSYPVGVHIEGDTGRLYGGMTADITFITDSAEEVLYVSRKAIVYNDEDKAQVYIKKGTSYELKDVEVGFSDGTYIQIVSGLEEGDTVYIVSKVTEDEDSLKNGLNAGEIQADESQDGQLPDGISFPDGGDVPNGGNIQGGGGFPGGGGSFEGGFPGGGPG